MRRLGLALASVTLAATAAAGFGILATRAVLVWLA
jgi:hypothetical protein